MILLPEMNVTDFKKRTGTRLKQYFSLKNLNQKDFAKSINQSPVNISRVVQGKSGLSTEMVFSITTNYPLLNLDWLLLGRGPMEWEKAEIGEINPQLKVAEPQSDYKTTKVEDVLNLLNKRIEDLEKLNETKDEVIELLKIKRGE